MNMPESAHTISRPPDPGLLTAHRFRDASTGMGLESVGISSVVLVVKTWPKAAAESPPSSASLRRRLRVAPARSEIDPGNGAEGLAGTSAAGDGGCVFMWL